MAQVKEGDSVKVHYTGKLESGEVFDTSKEREPFEFTVGAGNVIPGFEKGVVGMSAGQSKTVTVPPEDGYGPTRDELVIEVNKTDFPEHITPEVGQRLQMRRPDGNNVNVVVSNIAGENVTLDANHPLAGKTLVFEIELLDVK
jgi:peptidylprolyl isomerase